MTFKHLLKILEPYNPWWTDKKWYLKDPLIKDFDSSILKREPRLFYHIRSYLPERNCYGIVTIRGPRRVGKSTLVKLLIKDLIERGTNPRNIFYVSLDYGDLNVPLFKLLQIVADSVEGDKYIFLDEASMYLRWALDLKNAHDAGIIERGRLKIVATGSHSMDLVEAASKLRGRQGCLAEKFNVGANLLHVPLRFPEVVEALHEEINDYFADSGLRRSAVRFEVLLELKSGNIPPILRNLYSGYFQLLRSMFENYLIHGGYPKAVNEFYENDYIHPGFYRDVAELLISDCEKAGLDSENLKRVLEFMLKPSRISGLLSLNKSPIIGRNSEGRPKGKFKLGEYLDYLRNTWSFFFSYLEAKNCMPNYLERQKIYVLDPFIYHALYSYLNNIPDPFEHSKKIVSDPTFKGLIVESVIASHLLLSQQLFEHVPSVEYSKVLMYRRSSGSKEETDFILCIAKTVEKHRFLIESKYRGKPSTHPESGKIVLTYDTFRVKGDTVYIPVCLFLVLF